jgi:hypothetical protein
VIGEGTYITIIARGSLQRFIGATNFRVTEVFGAGVIVITQQIVGLTIAVVVEAITNLRGRDHGVARGQTFLRANPLARAGTEFVGCFTGCPEGQVNRLFGTGAIAGIGNTLFGFYAIDGLCGGTGEPPWTIAVNCTCATAEGAFVAIIDADIFSSGYTLAVVTGSARAAEICVVGDADKNEVGSGACHLLAAPARGTFSGTLLSANSFAHMLNAPARKTLFAIPTRVEETTVARVTQTAQVLHHFREEQLKSRVEGGDVNSQIATDNIGNHRRTVTVLDVTALKRIQQNRNAPRASRHGEHKEHHQDHFPRHHCHLCLVTNVTAVKTLYGAWFRERAQVFRGRAQV